MKKNKKPTREYPFICHDCAIKMGGKWPEGHCATCHTGTCEYCGKEKSLANIGDYDWLKQSFIDMRD